MQEQGPSSKNVKFQVELLGGERRTRAGPRNGASLATMPAQAAVKSEGNFQRFWRDNYLSRNEHFWSTEIGETRGRLQHEKICCWENMGGFHWCKLTRSFLHGSSASLPQAPS